MTKQVKMIDDDQDKYGMTYVERMQKFQKYMDKQVGNMLDELDTKGYDEKYNIVIKINEQELEMSLNADVYEALTMLLNVEIDNESPVIDKFVSNEQLKIYDDMKEISENADNDWRTKVYNHIVYCLNYCKEQQEDRKILQEDEDKLLQLDKLTKQEFDDMFTVIDTMLVD